MKIHRLLLFSVEWEKVLFPKKCENHKKKQKKNKTQSRNCFLIQFHILCTNFRKVGWRIKKNAKFCDSLRVVWFKPIGLNHGLNQSKKKTNKPVFLVQTNLGTTISFKCLKMHSVIP